MKNNLEQNSDERREKANEVFTEDVKSLLMETVEGLNNVSFDQTKSKLHRLVDRMDEVVRKAYEVDGSTKFGRQYARTMCLNVGNICLLLGKLANKQDVSIVIQTGDEE